MTMQRYEIGEGAFGTFAHLRGLSCTFLHFYLHTDLTELTDIVAVLPHCYMAKPKSVRSVRSVWENEIYQSGVLLLAHGSHGSHGKGFACSLGFSEIIKDGADLASGEILAVGVVASGCKLIAELGNAVDPTHQVAGGGARVAVGEVEERKLLFAVTTDFHNAGCLIVVVTLGLLMSNADVYDFFYGTYDA